MSGSSSGRRETEDRSVLRPVPLLNAIGAIFIDISTLKWIFPGEPSEPARSMICLCPRPLPLSAISTARTNSKVHLTFQGVRLEPVRPHVQNSTDGSLDELVAIGAVRTLINEFATRQAQTFGRSARTWITSFSEIRH